MTSRSKFAVTLGLVVLLGGMGVADYLFSGNQYVAQVGNSEETDMTPPEGAVRKNTGPAVEDMIVEQGLTPQTSDDLSLLAQVVTDGTVINAFAVLQDNDRAGSVVWVESPKVKDYFIALKDALLVSFSPQMQGLRDETTQAEGKPVRNILTFLDPVLSEERIVFVRVRERLYEFHITEGKEQTMNDLIESLTSR